MELEGLVWMAILPPPLVAAAGLAVVAQGLVHRRWREFPAEWPAVDLAMPLLFLVIGAGVVAQLLRPATRRDFQASRRGSGPRTG